MDLKDWVFSCITTDDGHTSLTKEEVAATERFVANMAEFFEARGVEVTPLVGLRTADVASCWLRVRAISSVDGDSGGPEQATTRRAAAKKPSPEAVAKAWDRLRKANKDLEEMLPEKGAPNAVVGLPDLMKPIIKKAEGVLEGALKYEAKKRERKKRGNGKGQGAQQPPTGGKPS